MKNILGRFLFFWILLLTIQSVCYGQQLSAGFASPPSSTKPGVYWYWINEHVSKDGITKDLEALEKIGIGEVFIGNIYIKGLLLGDIKTLSPEWLQLMQFAIKEGSRIGINVSMFNSAGWSQSGGPWIRPEEAMRYLVSSQTQVEGGQVLKMKLPKPREFFQDVALLAMPIYPCEKKNKPFLSSVPNATELPALVDNDISTSCKFENKRDEQIQIDIRFDSAVTKRSLILFPSNKTFKVNCEVYSKNGSEFRLIKKLYFDRIDKRMSSGPEPFAPLVFSLNETVALEYRIILRDIPERFELNEIIFSSRPKLENYPEKLLNKMLSTSTPNWYAYMWDNQEQNNTNGIIPVNQITNISNFLNGDTLTWKAPKGSWEIIRIGMTTTGMTNGPAPASSVGLEIDKMNKRSLQYHYDSFVGKIVNGLSKEERKSFRRVIADSYETGPQNWTDDLRPIFMETYGYDPLPWLAVLTGNIIESVDLSNRFLWDLRRLVADRVASEYVGGMKEVCEKNGTELWLENYGWNGFPSEFLKYGKYAPEIGGEFWTNHGENIECRLAASACHIYGKNTVFAESYTTNGAPFEYYPGNLKRKGDESYTEGVNRHILHVTIHQPDEKKFPGINTWFGIEFNRQNTWFSESKSWIDYQRRCCFMLQQGKPSADVCFFIGEETPKMSGWVDKDLSKGYDYDFINADAIENILTVVNGRLTLPSGVSYSLLVLPPLKTMRPAVLKRLKELVEQGANILGNPVDHSPSLTNFPECDKEVQSLAFKVWGTTNSSTKEVISKQVGKGHVFCNVPIDSVLEKIGTLKVVSFDKNIPVLWKQRNLGHGQLYFLTNQGNETHDFNATFRINGFVPELWNPIDGTTRPLAEFSCGEKTTKVPLHLIGGESCFIVFRNIGKAPKKSLSIGGNYPEESIIATLIDNWNIEFFNKWTKERFEVKQQKLMDWSKSSDDRIKYFSGTATYKTDFEIPSLNKNKVINLNIGNIQVIGSVIINGKQVGSELWSAPYRINIASYLLTGKNHLEIKVTNLWRNKILEQVIKPKNKQALFLLHNPIKANQPLLPSGMWGEVTITSVDI